MPDKIHENSVWKCIEVSKQKAVNLDAQIECLTELLLEYEAKEILQMCVAFEAILVQGYSPRLLGAGEIINGYCYEEELDFFLSFLIKNGRDFWVEALNNTDLFLAKELNQTSAEFRSEAFRNVWTNAYFKKRGLEPWIDEDTSVMLMETFHEVGASEELMEQLCNLPIRDLNKEYPALYKMVSSKKESREITYKMYDTMSDEGELKQGEIWEVYVASPYALTSIHVDDFSFAFIPPYTHLKHFFAQGGGGFGGMSPGAGWNAFELKHSEYLEFKKKLLGLDPKLAKKEHFYYPDRFVVDSELNEAYPEAKEWRKQFQLKYSGVNDSQQFPPQKELYKIIYDGEELGDFISHGYTRPSIFQGLWNPINSNWRSVFNQERLLPPGFYPHQTNKQSKGLTCSESAKEKLSIADVFDIPRTFNEVFFGRKGDQLHVIFQTNFKIIHPQVSPSQLFDLFPKT